MEENYVYYKYEGLDKKIVTTHHAEKLEMLRGSTWSPTKEDAQKNLIRNSWDSEEAKGKTYE